MHKAVESQSQKPTFPRSLSSVVMGGKKQKWLRPKKSQYAKLKKECDEMEANENNLWKTVQQPAKNAISSNMSSEKWRCYEDAICFKGPVQLELTVLVFHSAADTNNHEQPPTTTTTTKEIALLPEAQYAQSIMLLG